MPEEQEQHAPDATAPPVPPAPRLWSTRTLLSAVVTLAVFVVLLLSIDLEAVWREIQRCDKGLVVLGMLAHYSTYLVRGVRWRRTLRHLHGNAGFGKFSLLVFFYNFVDNIVPAKLGDVYGAHLARINLGISRSAALGSIVFQRMIDAWIVAVLAAVASFLVFSKSLPRSVMWALVFGVVLAVVVTIILVLFALLKKVPAEKIPKALRSRLDAFRSGMWPRNRELASIAGLTAAIWALESLWIYLLCRAFGIALDPAELLVVTMIPLLATAFPLTPSGAGAVELTLYGSLRAVGVASPLAQSVTVLNRLIDYWLHIGLGILVWALREHLGLRTWREVPLEESAPET